MWFALDVIIEEEAREAVEWALMEAGALGTEAGGAQVGGGAAFDGGGTAGDGAARVLGDGAAGGGRLALSTAYFERRPGREEVRARLAEALRIYGLPGSAAREMSVREVEARDWLGEWKKNWRPVEVGGRFVVAPPWSEIEETADRLVVRIEPGMAFGTGTHETTRLCLAAIEKHFAGGSFLDVGTGTGVLAIAAAKLREAARVEACDTDADAVRIAEENARLNGVAGRVSFRVGTVDEATAAADFVCANLTADVILALLPSLAAASCGRLVLSGILAEQTATVLAALHTHGVYGCEVERAGEWVAIISRGS